MNIEQKSVNAIRVLAADTVQKANSGHPGMPLGSAAMAYELWANHLTHNPKNPKWVNRDRFILSAGHASSLLYSLLHLFGYGLTIEDMKNFRQDNSLTPGHPEYGHTVGVEATTGPLGAGMGMAVGMAMAQAHMAATFNTEDYNVIEAGNGEEGVAMADKYIPKLIISDIMMPVKDGFECSREIRENKRTFHIPVIFLTAKAEDADRLKSLRIGVDDYIMKPFNPELLKEKVKALIEQRDLLRKLYAKTLMMDEDVLESSEDVHDVFMPKMLQIIEENLSNRNFTIKVLTDKLNMSQPTLYRKVKQKTGLSIIEVIHGVRMSKAASIIMSRRYSSLTEVAEMVGYDSMISFRKQFVAQFGVLPSKYMEEKMRK